MPNIYKRYSTKELGKAPQNCDRCGNDFQKNWFAWHLPFSKMYIYFCHICHAGMMYGFYKDVLREIKDLTKNG